VEGGDAPSAGGRFTCVQEKPGNDACRDKAAQKCVEQLAAADETESALRQKAGGTRRRELIWTRDLANLCIVTKVQIGELRDRVSHYVRRAERGETIVIVNRSREVALLSPWRPRRPRSARLLGCLKGTASIRGDIVSPIIPADEWFRS
jgi:prevent-host-death family protein